MNEIEKLFKRISKKEKVALEILVEKLLNKDEDLRFEKLQGSDFYRLRKGNFRIIFHYNQKKEIIIDSIRLRNEKTYRGF